MHCLLAEAKPVKKGRKRKLAATDGPKKPTVISTNSQQKKSLSPAKKKAKKRNPWSDSEESAAADDSDRSDVDMDASFGGDIVEREKAPRRAAGWLHYSVMLS